MSSSSLLLLFDKSALMRGQGIVSLLPFTDTFDRANGDLDNGWEYTTGLWIVSGNAAFGIPGQGPELVINGNFVSGTTGWSGVDASLASVAGGQSGNCLQVTNSTTATGYAKQVVTTEVGKWYLVSIYHKNGTASNQRLRLGPSEDSGAYGFIVLNDADWTQHFLVVRATSTTMYVTLKINTATSGLTSLWDIVTVKALILADQFSSRDLLSSSVDISVPITLTSWGVGANITAWQTQGIVLCLDSTITPANFIVAYHDGYKAALIECVGGVWSNLIAPTTTTYVALATLRVVKNGVNISLYYNGTQVGTTIDLTGKVYLNNTKHGLFSTSGAANFASFAAVNP